MAAFDDSVLLRLPRGIDSFTEISPDSAYASPLPATSVGCEAHPRSPEITNGFLMLDSDDRSTDLAVIADEWLGDKLNCVEGVSEGGGEERSFGCVTQYMQAGEIRRLGYLGVRTAHGRMVFTWWETQPEDFPALRLSFEASVESVLLLPP